MTHIEVRCRCGGEIIFEPLAEVPPPPRAILAVGGPPPEEWKGWVWVCSVCGDERGVSYDYGELDLGIVRDSVLHDREPLMDVEIFGEER